MAIFEGRKSSNDITNNDRMSDDEVVASYVPPRYLFQYGKPICTSLSDQISSVLFRIQSFMAEFVLRKLFKNRMKERVVE